MKYLILLLSVLLSACATTPDKSAKISLYEQECTEYMSANYKPGNTAEQQRNLFYACMSGKGAY